MQETLLERDFSAGCLRCVLSRVDGGQWGIAGMQVRIANNFLPAGPLETWHDTEPFGELPAEELVAETEEAEAPAA